MASDAGLMNCIRFSHRALRELVETKNFMVGAEISLKSRISLVAASIAAIAGLAILVSTMQSRGGASASEPISAASRAELRQKAMKLNGSMPRYFEVNQGQADHSVRYLSRGDHDSLFLTNDAAVFSLIGGETRRSALPGMWNPGGRAWAQS